MQKYKIHFEKLIRPYLDMLYRRAFRLTGNPDDAEDLVQDYLFSLYRKEIVLSEYEDLASWLLRGLYNRFIDSVRKQQRTPDHPGLENDDAYLMQLPESAPGPLEYTLAQASLKQIQSALDKLSLEQRMLVVLHDVEGFTLAELEEKLDTPLGTLKSRLHRARQEIRKKIMQPFHHHQRVTG